MVSTVWATDDLFDIGKPKAVIILNSELPHATLFRDLWAAASFRICADGGANRLYDSFKDELKPDLIKGDFDSLREDVASHFSALGVKLVEDPDQFSTDLDKCIKEVEARDVSGSAPHSIVLVGGLTGRLDQTFHTLHTLLLYSTQSPNRKIYVISEQSVAAVLGAGEHTFAVDLKRFGKTCGLLPIAGESKVATKGLEWDLGPTAYMYPTSMSTAISTSNHLLESSPGSTRALVQIETDKPIVWTIEVRSPAP